MAASESVFDIAEAAGLLSLSPSDLVFESSQLGFAYYDYVLSTSADSHGDYHLYLVKFDAHTNVEWLETAEVPVDILTRNRFDNNEVAIVTLGVLIWKAKVQHSRVLCLVKNLDADCVHALEALKRAASKFKCSHHVISINGRKMSTSASNKLFGRKKGSRHICDSMRLRVMMCQTRSKIESLPTQAIRETRCLLNPTTNPILCLCLPLS
ncbi:hypothetical protein AB6A40_007987 [Gnathostoma spinigerum]|uniref:Uncharacterized protein n=1 Tax=Gnathostoma spinigerum TaxID=75299 RepID=A0ABD6EMV1_9BILA